MPTAAPHRPIEGPSAWQRGGLRPEDYRVTLSPACLDEIRRLGEELRQFPLPAILRRPDEHDLPRCREAMSQVRRMLDGGAHFAIVDRLPLDEIGAEAATGVNWLLSSPSWPAARRRPDRKSSRCSGFRGELAFVITSSPRRGIRSHMVTSLPRMPDFAGMTGRRVQQAPTCGGGLWYKKLGREEAE